MVCNKQNERFGRELIAAKLNPIQSCLDSNEYVHLKRAILEVIATSNMANTREDLEIYVNHTLYCQRNEISFEYLKKTSSEEFKAVVKMNSQKKVNDLFSNKETELDPIKNSINFLLEYEFIRLHQSNDGDDIKFVPTRLGLACLTSSLSPREGFMLFQELIKARQNFVLECDLHAIYLVTPYSITHQLDSSIDWHHFEDLYDKLPNMMKRVGEMVGISAQFFIKAIRGRNVSEDFHLLAVHKRFYIALALQDLVNEVPIAEVASKFKIKRATLQTLQQSASAFAGTVTNFCDSLEWNLMVLIIKQFRERLYFGIHPDLIDLMRIQSMTSTKIARALYKGKIRNLNDLAIARKVQVEDILIGVSDKNGLFMSGNSFEMAIHDVAKMLINDAQMFLQSELGIKGVKWNESQNTDTGEKSEVVNESGAKNLNISRINTNLVNQKKSTRKLADDSTKFKTPIQKSTFTSAGTSNKTLDSRKRKISNTATNESPQIFDTPKKSKVIEKLPEYKQKLRSSGSKTDLLQLSSAKDTENSDSENVKDEISYENMSLFNNHGVSLDDDELMHLQSTGVEKFLKIVEIESEIDLKTFLQAISKKSEVAVSIGVSIIPSKASTIGGNVLKAQKSSEKFVFKEKFFISCMSFCCDNNKVFYFDLQRGNRLATLKKIFTKTDVTFSMFECKENLKILNETKICTNFDALKTKDPKIAAWFIDPDMNFKWIEIIEKFTPIHIEIFNLLPHQRGSSSIGLDYRYSVPPKDRTAIEAFLVKELLKAQKMDIPTNSQISQKSQAISHLKVFTKLEMPIQKILANMEITGFPVDVNKLYKMIENSIILKRNLEEHIYRLNGGRFDITNKASVAKVVGIYKESGKKLSTAKEVMSKIDSPIAACISNFRTLSTTISNLQPMTHLVNNGRVHGSSFSLTQTGRISMGDPNLQNVTKDFIVEYQGKKLFNVKKIN